jgi:hypothetical protein
MTTPYERVLDDLAETLRGPRRARQRLLDEIAEDLKDAGVAERAAGLSRDAAEALVAARFGNPTVIADQWNSDQARRRRSIQRNALVLVTAMTMAGGLGITQYASGTNSPTPSPAQCRKPTVVGSRSSTISGLLRAEAWSRQNRLPPSSECETPTRP